MSRDVYFYQQIFIDQSALDRQYDHYQTGQLDLSDHFLESILGCVNLGVWIHITN